MQFHLDNIGIIRDSTLSLNGLTVITGKNSSGKTTVGKALYALIDSTSNLPQKARSDRQLYIQKQLQNILDEMDVLRLIRTRLLPVKADLFKEYPALDFCISKDLRVHSKYGDKDMEALAHELAAELKTFDSSLLNVDLTDTGITRLQLYPSHGKGFSAEEISSLFDTQREKASMQIEKLLSDLDNDPELIDYTRECIDQTLLTEFCQQVQPVKAPEAVSTLRLSDNGNVYFDLTIDHNHVADAGKPIFFGSPFKSVYLIDDPFVLDNITNWVYRPTSPFHAETILNPARIYSHNEKLKFILKFGYGSSIFEQTLRSDALRELKKKLDAVIPGSFDVSGSDNYYVHNGAKLQLSNLATGSKMFSIMKMLIERGELDSASLLILDEPEAHLHPQWQNAFAEMLMLLIRHLGVTVVLTTHSPNFMLALDAYMRKYRLADRTNFYQTDEEPDGFVRYRCVNDDMGLIYQDFLQYLSEVKMLRNLYLHGGGEPV